MAILNYTSKVDVHKTIGEISKCLVERGAKEISVTYDGSMPTALRFVISINDNQITFQLPARHKGVLKAMEKARVAKSYQNDEQALRCAWRIIKDWVEAQMAIVEAELAEVSEVFLPYAITQDGKTIYEKIKEKPGQFLLK